MKEGKKKSAKAVFIDKKKSRTQEQKRRDAGSDRKPAKTVGAK